MKKSIFLIIVLLFLSYFGLKITGYDYLLAGVKKTYLSGHSTSNINDHTGFNTRLISNNDATTQPWPLHPAYNTTPLSTKMEAHIKQYKGAAFLVAHQGKILTEHYYHGYDNRSKTNAFSMAKTVVTLLLGMAIEEGYIDGLNQPITDWLPEFKQDKLAQKATIGSLSTMSSGYEWTENYYSTLSPTVKLYYGNDIKPFVLSGHFSKEPESYFYYSSASTQLLGIILERALKKKRASMTISDYLSEKIWQPLGMNDNALWHMDGNGMELVYCCLNTNARNFAKLGQLMLQQGEWNNQQLIAKDYINLMTTPKANFDYGYATWINNTNTPNFYTFRGHLGQYIIVVPSSQTVIVYLGETRDATIDTMHDVLPFFIEEARRLTP